MSTSSVSFTLPKPDLFWRVIPILFGRRDVAFVVADKVLKIGDESAFIPFAPDLAIEVISPSDSFSNVEEKAFSWLGAGTRLVLLVDPANETVHVYRSADNIAVLGKGDVIWASDVVDGWEVAVAKLFQ